MTDKANAYGETVNRKNNPINVLILPSQKLFYLPAVAIYEHYRSQGEHCVIVISEKVVDEARGIHPGFEKIHDVWAHLDGAEEINLVALQHNSEIHFKTLKSWMTKINKLSSSIDLTVTLIPDGFGNKFNGNPLPARIEAEGQSIKIRQYLSFGFTHESISMMKPAAECVQIDLDVLADFFDRSEAIKKMSNLDAFSGLKDRDCIIVPFRPWCTKKFQNGKYDFGSIAELSDLYLKQSKRAEEQLKLENPILVFRPDERFLDESAEVYACLSRHYEAMNTGEIYPQALTLEPLVYYLVSHNFISNACMLCLDSTSFQTVPFLLNGRDNIKLSAFMGAAHSEVGDMTGGEKFLETKLRPKLNDFAERYTKLKADGFIDQIEILDDVHIFASL